MLVLADADRLRIDLDQLSQRILQAAGDRHRAAQGDVEIGQLVRSEGRRRINGSAGFRDDDLRHLQVSQQLHQIARQLVRFARGGAVADRDEIDAVLDRELAEHCQRFIPSPLRFMRVDRRRIHHLAGGIDHRDLDTGTVPGIEPHGDTRARGRCQQQIAKVRREHPHRLGFRRGPKPHAQVDVEMHLDFRAPRPAHRFRQPLVAGAALIGNGKALHDLALIGAGGARRHGFSIRLDLQLKHLFLFAAEHREDAVGRQLGQRLAEIEIVLELFALGLLALADRGNHPTVRPHLFTELADQVGVFREALHQDGARAFQRSGAVCHLLVRIDEACGDGLRIVFGLRQQQFGQGLQSGFLGDLGLGAALRLERQVDVFQTSLAVGGKDRSLQRRVELTLFADRIEDGGATRFKLTQVSQALFEVAQLRVIEAARHLLAVPGDKGNGCPAVEQRNGRFDLLVPYAEFLRNLAENVRHAKPFN